MNFDLLPRLAAVDRLVEAAFRVRSPEVAHRRDVGDVRVLGVNDDAADVVGVGEAAVRPGLAAVGGLENAVAPTHRVARIALARADVNHLRLRLTDRDRADALRRFADRRLA